MTGFQLWVSSWDQFVTVEKSELFDGPSKLFSTNDELPPGVHLLGQQKDNWIKILYPSRFQGWIFKNNKVKFLGD